MRVSVVINTYNRATSLRHTLDALAHQTYRDFEVVVVNGPSADGTAALLADRAADLRAVACPEVHLSKSRNLGIDHAAGEVVAFIDDDGVPEPQWLAELVSAYDHPKVGGVGGIVYDHTGYHLQYAGQLSDRKGNPVPDQGLPHAACQMPGADPFVHLLGTNASFCRTALEAIGGFDEEIEYFLDETDVALRLTDAGYWVRLLDHAPVHHKFLPSHLRGDRKTVKHPYPIVKNKLYFAVSVAVRDGSPVAPAAADGLRFAEHMTEDADRNRAAGRLSAAERAAFGRELDAAVRDGLTRGLAARPPGRPIAPRPAAAFKPYPTVAPAGRRFVLAFVSQEYPPARVGGVGRYTHAVAAGLAAAGHEVHVVTRTPDRDRVDREDGVWVHRVRPHAEGPWATPDLSPLERTCLGWAAAAHAEVRRVANARPLDLVTAPVWDCEGLFCQTDPGLTTSLLLVTSLTTACQLDPRVAAIPGMDRMLDRERGLVRSARHLLAPSRDVLAKAERDHGRLAGKAAVVPLGLPDRPVPLAPKPAGRVRVLAVGRLEPRKGTDLLLAAAAVLCPQLPHVEFVLVGNDALPADGESSYKERFRQQHGAAAWADRVRFRGEVDDAELAREYAGCDVFCLPARYESFGLVLVEAMSHGKPVVAGRVGGMPEVVADGRTGILVEPDGVAGLVAALRKLAADPALRAKLGAAGRREYEERFTVAEMVRGTLAAVAAAVAPEPAAAPRRGLGLVA